MITKTFEQSLEKKHAYEESLERFVKLIASGEVKNYEMIKHLFESTAELYNEVKRTV